MSHASWLLKSVPVFNPRRLAAVAGMFVSVFAFEAGAQTANEVELTTHDGRTSVRGVMLDYDGVRYVLQTELGTLTLYAQMLTCSGAGCPKADGSLTQAEPEAEVVDTQVKLISRSDDTEVVGDLVDYTDSYYVVETPLGSFQLATDRVDCVGAACPDLNLYDPKVTLRGDVIAVDFMMPALLLEYARERGHRYQIEKRAEGFSVVTLVSGEDGSVVAEIDMQPAGATETVFAPDIMISDQQAELADKTQEFLIATSGQVLIAADKNPVRDLNAGEISDILSGDLLSWEKLGGGDTPITLHLLERETPVSLFQGSLDLPDRGVAADTVYHASAEALIASVRTDRTALGILDRVQAMRGRADMLSIRKVCGLVAEPSDFDMKIKNYPLSRPIFAHAKPEGLHPVANDFLNWAQTDAAQAVLEDADFVSTKLQRMKIQDMGVALIHAAASEPDFSGAEFSSMMRELRRADRLSITFRFENASSRLDAESVLNIQDLANRLRKSEFDGLELLLVGFADSIGDAQQNTRLAQQRAEAVQDVLAAEFASEELAKFNIQALSFGEQMPLDCNDTDEGRASNRRVEVWVRVPEKVLSQTF